MSVSWYVPLSGHDDFALLNDFANDAESIQNYIIFTSLKSETMGKLIKRMPGLCILISSLQGSALRPHVESLDNPRDVNKHSQSPSW